MNWMPKDYKEQKEFWDKIVIPKGDYSRLALLQKWMEDIENGTYPQGKHYLLNTETNCYCILGTMCETYISLGGTGVTILDNISIDGVACRLYGMYSSTPPSEVIDSFGLAGDMGQHNHVLPNGTAKYRSLSSLNDAGASFKELLELIRSEPEGLFLYREG